MQQLDNFELERVIRKKSYNTHTVDGVGLDDLNAALFDNILLERQKRNSTLTYLTKQLIWVLSKLTTKKLKLDKSIILVPAEVGKNRSIGLYIPVTNLLTENSFELVPLIDFLKYISINIFFEWFVSLPRLFNQCINSLKVIADDDLSTYRNQIIIDSLVSALLVRQFQHQLLSSKCKKIVVDWDRHKFQSLIVVASKKVNLKTYTFVHGAIYTPTKFVPLKADYVFTWGRNHNVFFTNLQERKNKYLKVGNPRFKNVLLKKQVVLDKYGIDTSKKIILHPSQNFPDLNDFEVIEKLVKCIAATKEFILAVKFHPSQNNKSLISKIESLKGIIILDESMSVTECLSISDITLLVSSTFAIDSLVAQIPVIVYSPDRTLRGIACELVGVGKCLQYSDFNLGELSSLLNDKGYNEKLNLSKQLLFIKNYCEFYNKQSAKLISDILQDEIH